MSFLKKAKNEVNKLRGVEPEKTPKQIKDEVADIRRNSENLKTSLMSIRFKESVSNGEEANIPADKMKHYMETSAALVYLLDHSQTYSLDTRPLDQRMADLPKHLQQAITNGREDTADRILTALLYGIGKGHKAMISTDDAHVKKEMEDRLNRLEQYCTIVSLSEKIDESQNAIDKLAVKFEETATLYKEKKSALESQRKENPYLFEKLNSVKSRHEAEDPDVLNLVVQMDQVTDLSKEISQLKQEKTTHVAAIQGFDTSIRSEENMLMMSDVVLEQELMDNIEQDMVEFRNKVSDAWDQIFKLGDLSDQNTFALNAIFSSAGISSYVTGVSMEYEDILRAERKAEEGMRRARELAEELAKEQANEETVENEGEENDNEQRQTISN